MTIEKSFDVAQCKVAVATLWKPDSVVELRILNTRQATVSGYFNDPEKLAQEAGSWSGKVPGVYLTLNPVNPDLLARAQNRLIPYAKHTTSDSDILCRCWLPIDLDPQRPAGISSTDAEHEAALRRAQQVQGWLATQGWPEPFYADSGNGAHLLYRIELPNDPESLKLVERCLKALSLQFGDEVVGVDVKTANAARIWKLYGTLACKGDSTPDRPHRLARILELPKVVTVVDMDCLEQLGGMLPEEPKSEQQPIYSGRSDFSIEHWIEQHNLPIVSDGPWNGGRKWILNPCPWSPEHTNQAAYIVQHASGAIAAGCHHNGCADKGWHDLRDVVEPGWRQQRSRITETNPSGRTRAGAEQEEGDESEKNGEKKKGVETQAAKLVKLALQDVELFRDQTQTPHALVGIQGHYEVLRCRSRAFKRWLTRRMYEAEEKVPGAEAVSSASNVIEAKAVFEGEQYPLHNRVAVHDNATWYDLTDEAWRTVRITPDGWQIINDPPILFTRHEHHAAQVTPVAGGDVHRLFEFIPVTDEGSQILVAVWLVTCFVPDIPHPIPILHGPQGSGKSFTSRLLRRLVDPSVIETLSFPRDNNELIQKLSHHWLAIFDNIDSLYPWQSDALCRASTGEGFTKRQLYTDDEDVIYRFRRCVGLNGINPAATRPDLLDRSILIPVDRIPPDQRREEKELDEAFQAAQPHILGGILDALSQAMKLKPDIRLTSLPRMADFARWGCAIAQALGYCSEDFLGAYRANIRVQNAEVLDGHPVAAAVLAFMDDQPEWKGEPAQLLEQLGKVAEREKIDIRAKSWPKAAHILTRRLNEVKPNLQDVGILVDRSRPNRRVLHIRRVPGSSVGGDEATAALQDKDLQADATATLPQDAPVASEVASDSKSLQDNGSDATDATDATFPTTTGDCDLKRIEL